MRRRSLLVLSVLLVASVLAVGTSSAQSDEPDWFVVEEQLPFDAVEGFEDSTREWGVWRGAGYRYEIPADWNGDLVMWAHGFRGDGPELTVDNPPFREYLLEQGYAWGASSYDRNDYDVLSGAVSTKILASYMMRRVLPERPEHIYLAGASMGGHITGYSMERYRWLYDGAMPVCGVMGDYELFDIFLDFNVAAQQLGTGSSAFPVDPIVYVTETVPAIKASLELGEGTWPLALNDTGTGFRQLVENITGGDRPNFDEAFAFWNTIPDNGSGPGNFLFDLGLGDGSLPNSGGRSVVDNTDTVYQLDLDPAISPEEQALNDGIVRTAQDAGARRTEAITGKISDPVLTMHNLGDLFVPYAMQIDYAEDVASFGREHLLVQRAIRGSGHCDFTVAEYEQGFADLVRWVEDGVRPEGDVVLDPAAVAAADYGCRWTDPAPDAHFFAAPCPSDDPPGDDDGLDDEAGEEPSTGD
ncbi:MAG: hypothetical protein AAGA17_17860 [Actinomycetota bacterium]